MLGIDYTIDNFTPNNSFWYKYDNVINQMSTEQKIFVSKQKEVIESKQNLMSAFMDFLFEQHKNSFVSSDIAKDLISEYLTTVQDAANKYVSRSDLLEKENEELKKQIQLLLKNNEVKNDKQKTTS